MGVVGRDGIPPNYEAAEYHHRTCVPLQVSALYHLLVYHY
jgi:hypothetical protein